ncbi:PadR family transcriptional regulator [Aureimonas sp. AU20]|uniref:PadR family transcriptional regulator n=1 Tax=Aureimonas sp. AU20 TaxID=1349819 RepID=UPI000B2C07E8|nr:PadR family transcriptional regulator [Aureimonas sp. AU20]
MRQEFETRGRHGRSCSHGLVGLFAMGRGPFGRGPGRGHRHGGHGDMGGDGLGGEGGDGRIGRFLLQGDLRLLVLALIEKEPRHGYEIIKHIEEMTEGFYAPSPGVIYPTLSYLEEAGYILAESDGNKKRYAITDEGRAYLDGNRTLADASLGRLAQVSERLKERRERHGHRGEESKPSLPRGVEAAMLNLRDVAARALAADEKRSGEIIRLLLQAADDLDRGQGGSSDA